MKAMTADALRDLLDWSLLRSEGNLRLEDLAAQSHIPLRKLEAIERRDFAGLGPRAFAVGYLRSYAKFVGQNPDVFLEVLASEYPESDEADPLLPQRARRHLRFPRLPLVPIAVFALVAWLGWSVFRGHFGETELPGAGVPSSDTDIALTPAPTRLEDLIPSRTPAPAEAVEPSESAVDELADAALRESEDVDSPVHSDQGGADVDEAVVETVSSEALATQENPVSTHVVGDRNGEPLNFTFTEDCWLEVRDAGGKVLIAEVRPKGDNLRVFGQPPFAVMLGNAAAVTLAYGGESVSTAPAPGRKTLRLTVP